MKHGPRTILLKLLTILLFGSPYQWWTKQQVTAGSGQVRLQRSLDNEHVQLLLRATNAKIAGPAGTRQLKIFVMVNIKKFPRGILDQVISRGDSTEAGRRAPDPGLKQQAASVKLSNQPVQASSDKRQAPSCKLQASSRKQQVPRF